MTSVIELRLRAHARRRGGHLQRLETIAGARRRGSAIASLAATALDEGVEVAVARFEIRARVVDHAGERGDGGDERRSKVDVGLRRAHAALVVAVRRRQADLLAGEHTAGASEARPASR